MRHADSIADSANAISHFFGWRWRLKAPEWSAEFIANAKTRAAKDAAKRAAKTKRQNELRTMDLAERTEAWRAGEQVSIHGAPMLLRVKGDNVQTSQGASVPIEHAKRLWPAIKRCRATETAWQSNGHTMPIGHFRVDRIEADGTLRAGCHVIPFAELERMATTLGLA
jgi:hypothetical protein